MSPVVWDKWNHSVIGLSELRIRRLLQMAWYCVGDHKAHYAEYCFLRHRGLIQWSLGTAFLTEAGIALMCAITGDVAEEVDGVRFTMREKTLSLCGGFWVCPVTVGYRHKRFSYVIDAVFYNLKQARLEKYTKIARLIKELPPQVNNLSAGPSAAPAKP